MTDEQWEAYCSAPFTIEPDDPDDPLQVEAARRAKVALIEYQKNNRDKITKELREGLLKTLDAEFHGTKS